MALLTNPDGAAGILQSHSQPLASLHDDIVLIPQSVTRAQEMLPDIKREAATFRLKINVAKLSASWYVGNWSNHSQEDCVLRVSEGTIALVDDFQYHGT